MASSTSYRFSVFDMEQLVLLDGHLVYDEPSVGFCLWTYDYDIDTRTFCIDGYIEFKFPVTIEEVQAMHFFAEHSCICISVAKPDDIDYYNAVHTSVRVGWNPRGHIHVVTPVLETDEVLPMDAEAPQRSHACHDLSLIDDA